MSASIRRRTLPCVNIGILGCGNVSDRYFDGLARHEFLTVVACADLDRDRAEEKAARQGIARVRAPDELMADPEVELLVNLTPPQVHAAASMDAVSSGKHVWSEKPLAASLADAGELLRAADAAGVRLGCAPDTFLGGGIQTAIKLLDDGWLGDIITGGVAMVTEPGYETWHPDVASFYRQGGGPLLDLGPYYVTALVAMLGPVARVTSLTRTTFPERTIAVGPRRGERVGVEVPTHVTGALEFEQGPVVTLLVSWDVLATNLPYLELYGERGSWPSRTRTSSTASRAFAGPDVEDFEQPPPPPGTVPWYAIPLAESGDVGRGVGVADMALRTPQGAAAPCERRTRVPRARGAARTAGGS